MKEIIGPIALVALALTIAAIFLMQGDKKRNFQKEATTLTDDRFVLVSRSSITGHSTIYVIKDTKTGKEYTYMVNVGESASYPRAAIQLQ